MNLHKDWMIRSYVLTLSFVSFRFVEDILQALEVGTNIEILALMSWACWAIPLFIVEVIIQGKKLKANALVYNCVDNDTFLVSAFAKAEHSTILY